MKYLLLFTFVLMLSENCFAQDTFYVKKKQPKQVVANSPRPVWTPDNRDSIVTYTAEFQKPGTNVYAVVHEKGPYLRTPSGAYDNNGRAVRVIFTEIIAIDPNGVRYRWPDMVEYNGVRVPLKAK